MLPVRDGRKNNLDNYHDKILHDNDDDYFL